eukprot:TRINITY_DN746_c0_g1_i1.p2 TRINITY_DN746_c0_g1~~TRINITY_DN746_c0_g1_i1.p2  ORF type:complete len:143 (+),score=38.37 TRINITY_DN746_c0_g1_i1:18-446(+)
MSSEASSASSSEETIPYQYQPLSDHPSSDEEDSAADDVDDVDIDALVERQLRLDDKPVLIQASFSLDENQEKSLNSVALSEFDARYKEQVTASLPPSPLGAGLSNFGDLTPNQLAALEELLPTLTGLKANEFPEIFGTISLK